MRIAVAGGIFDKPADYRAAIVTPETNLVDGLRRRGVDTVAVGLYDPVPSRIDLLHVHHVGPIAVRAMLRTGPVVLTRHRAPDVVAAGWKGRVVEAALLRRCAALVALTETEAAHFRGALRGRPTPVIRNGIDADLFTPSTGAAPPEGDMSRELLFVGQLLTAKGVFDLLEALGRLLPTRPDLRLRVVAHVQPERAAFDAAVRQRGLADRVVVEAGMHHRELVHRYRRAAVLVLPSHDTLGEALPSVTAEAALTGTPVVSTQLPGVREQLGPLATYVPQRSPALLASALATVLDREPEARQALARARPALVAALSTDGMVERHLELYRSLVGGSR